MKLASVIGARIKTRQHFRETSLHKGMVFPPGGSSKIDILAGVIEFGRDGAPALH